MDISICPHKTYFVIFYLMFWKSHPVQWGGNLAFGSSAYLQKGFSACGFLPAASSVSERCSQTFLRSTGLFESQLLRPLELPLLTSFRLYYSVSEWNSTVQLRK